METTNPSPAPEVAAPATEAAAPDLGTASPDDASHSDGTTTTTSVAAVPSGATEPTRADDPWPSVDWDSWDGSVDSLPEQYHETAHGVSGWYDQDYQSKNEEIADLRSMYAAMLTGEEDPRVGELSTKLEEIQTQYNSRNTEYEELQAAMEATQEQAVSDFVGQFWREHKDLAESPEKLARFGPFIEDNENLGGMWEAYVAAELIELPQAAIDVGIKAKSDGVSDFYALKLAKAHAQLEVAKAQPAAPTAEEVAAAQVKAEETAKAKAPRTGAKITNGATRSSRPQVAKKTMSDAASLDEMRVLAARRAFAVHGGGRK